MELDEDVKLLEFQMTNLEQKKTLLSRKLLKLKLPFSLLLFYQI
jgi:hypothetical protein